jgi:hypothetical protein
MRSGWRRYHRQTGYLALRGEGVHHRCARRDHGRLEQVGQQAVDAVEALERLVRGAHLAHADALAHLAQHGQVDDQRHRQQRVLAGVVHHNRVLMMNMTHTRVNSTTRRGTIKSCSLPCRP